MNQVRLLVAAVILYFAWAGAGLKVPWPQDSMPSVAAPEPTAEQMEWAKPLAEKLPKMLAKDRQYLSDLYAAMHFVVGQDGKRSKPILPTTDAFIVLHGGSLQLAIEKAAVGKYPGLDDAIDQVFLAAAGPEPKQLDQPVRDKLLEACAVLSKAFRVNGE